MVEEEMILYLYCIVFYFKSKSKAVAVFRKTIVLTKFVTVAILEAPADFLGCS